MSEESAETKAAIELVTKRYESRLAGERLWADIGRATFAALRERGMLLPMAPRPGDHLLAAKYARMGKDFDTLMEAVNNDVMLTSEWHDLPCSCVYLRRTNTWLSRTDSFRSNSHPLHGA
jgi:hypothetical protein